MPFEIIRNDIVNMQVDAIVNTANPEPVVGYGVDAGIHQRAGAELLAAREKIGRIPVGKSAITPGFKLNCEYVIHTVGPVWQGGNKNEEKLLRKCYDTALKLAYKNKCESIAFPLLSAGNHGFPKELALEIAVNAFSSFLMKHEMHIYLVVFSKAAFSLSEKLFASVSTFIDENYIKEKLLDEYGVENKCNVREAELAQLLRHMDERRNNLSVCMGIPDEADFDNSVHDTAPAPKVISQKKRVSQKPFLAPGCPLPTVANSLENMLKDTDAGFSETLLKLIDKTGKKDSDIYKKANIDRKLFSKIRNNPSYKPSKSTALAFAIALELSLEETKDFIARAGYALSHSSKFDIIIEYFITNGKYDMFEINETLFAFDQNLLGA